jgi:hypothetical protein
MGCAASLLVEKNQDNFYQSMLSNYGGDRNLRVLTLRQVMQDPLGKKYFMMFLEKEHAEENLRFFEVIRSLI